MDRIFYDNQEFAKASEMFLKRVDLNSQADYDALTSSQKNDGTKLYFIPTPNYNWYYNEDKTLAVREKISDGSYRWYFNNYVLTDLYMPVPDNLQRFLPQSGMAGCAAWCEGWYDPDEHPDRVPNCVIGFYANTIRMWSFNLEHNMLGTCNNGVIYDTDQSIAYETYHGYEVPTFDPVNG